MQNKEAFPSKKLPTKNIDSLIELGIIDERGFFKKGKKKNNPLTEKKKIQDGKVN